MPIGWDSEHGGRPAIWKRPGQSDLVVRVLDVLQVRPGRRPAATVVMPTTRNIVAAPLAELFKRDNPREPFAP